MHGDLNRNEKRFLISVFLPLPSPPSPSPPPSLCVHAHMLGSNQVLIPVQ